jgi:hypothetical protein
MSSNCEVVENWRPGALFPAELRYLKHRVEQSACNVLIECGRLDGVSARWYSRNMPHLKVFSIDLDNDEKSRKNSIANLVGTSVEAVTGDVFDQLPRLVRQFRDGDRVAIVEDAVKGWPGIGLLCSMLFYSHVVLIAQHNLHTSHASRNFFNELAEGRAFLEDDPDPQIATGMRDPNMSQYAEVSRGIRERDVSSLGVLAVDSVNYQMLMDKIFRSRDRFGRWDPIKLRAFHSTGLSRYARRAFLLERLLPGLKRAR